MQSLPSASDILAALNFKTKALCSDLFLQGFSYKPLDFTMDLIVNTQDYQILKKLKSAKYISDFAAQKTPLEIIELYKENILLIQNGYIDYKDDNAFREVILPNNQNPFGIEILKNGYFRFFIKLKEELNITKLTINKCNFIVEQINGFCPDFCKPYILQTNINLNEDYNLSSNKSRFLVAFSESTGRKIILAGSKISREDFLGEALDI